MGAGIVLIGVIGLGVGLIGVGIGFIVNEDGLFAVRIMFIGVW